MTIDIAIKIRGTDRVNRASLAVDDWLLEASKQCTTCYWQKELIGMLPDLFAAFDHQAGGDSAPMRYTAAEKIVEVLKHLEVERKMIGGIHALALCRQREEARKT